MRLAAAQSLPDPVAGLKGPRHAQSFPRGFARQPLADGVNEPEERVGANEIAGHELRQQDGMRSATERHFV